MKIIDKSTYKLPERVRNVLLIQLGDIGDVVWTTPSIRAVKTSIPGSTVSLLVKEGFGGLLEADPSLECVFEIKKYQGNIFHQAKGQISFIKEIWSRHFDLVVDLRMGDRGAWMSFLSGAPFRVTMHHPEGVPFWRSYLFTHGVVPIHSIHTRGATEQSLSILRELGIDTDDVIPRLWIADSVNNRVKNILLDEKVDYLQHFVTLNPFSRWSYKEWDCQKWVEIINWICRDYAMPVMIIGSPEERSKVEILTQSCHGRAFNLAGRTTLAELAGILSLSRLHMGVDSAAPHIAAAVNTPTVTIYGPSSWKDWAPIGKDHRVVLPDMDCVPCHHKGCNDSGRSRCLEELDTTKVKNILCEAIDLYWTKS